MRNAKRKKDPPARNEILSLLQYRDELIDSSDPRSGLTGLEPAASALTGRCSDRLNYNPRKINKESIAIPFFHRERFIPSHKSHFSLFRYGNAMQEVSEIGLFLMMKTRYFKKERGDDTWHGIPDRLVNEMYVSQHSSIYLFFHLARLSHDFPDQPGSALESLSAFWEQSMQN
ncbi:hypothetical protein VNO80_06727 [Phaseolus coccineus]|uniref:Uncharacterized protein n=1 Tax=Phaseolus coccineus TaxID=3886 RepID=A0AAN9RER4_PHACN